MYRIRPTASIFRQNAISTSIRETIANLGSTSGGSARSTTHLNSQFVGGMESNPMNRSVMSSLVFSENTVGNLYAGE